MSLLWRHFKPLESRQIWLQAPGRCASVSVRRKASAKAVAGDRRARRPHKWQTPARASATPAAGRTAIQGPVALRGQLSPPAKEAPRFIPSLRRSPDAPFTTAFRSRLGTKRGAPRHLWRALELRSLLLVEGQSQLPPGRCAHFRKAACTALAPACPARTPRPAWGATA
jgi:hypothetical protein